jgi:hypothetical protein
MFIGILDWVCGPERRLEGDGFENILAGAVAKKDRQPLYPGSAG